MSQQGNAYLVSTNAVLCLRILFRLVFDSSLISYSYFLVIEFILYVANKIRHSHYLVLRVAYRRNPN